MNWTKLLNSEIEYTYGVTERLIDKVDKNKLSWKPATGKNWMTTGQLLMHISNACGACCRGFVTGDWGMPEGVDFSSLPLEAMLPPAEKLPRVKSVAEAKRLLKADRELALAMVKKAGEKRLAKEPAPAPWDPSKMILGQRLLSMVAHLNSHKGQLFYYLKLQGKPVNTHDLWGGC